MRGGKMAITKFNKKYKEWDVVESDYHPQPE